MSNGAAAAIVGETLMSGDGIGFFLIIVKLCAFVVLFYVVLFYEVVCARASTILTGH